ncbi:polysaccharide biosynthesis protein [Pigmentiphaga aceris]|nr:nucleoside-diphosphate sugar epimerase/dehydratase [Pigmentiphaga aceris]
MLAADALVLPLCLIAAYYVRLGDSTLLNDYGIGAPIIIALATIPVFHVCGLYRNVVRFVDMHLLYSTGVGLAVLAGSVYALSYIVNDPLPPRSSLFIYWFIAFAYVVLTRFGARHLLRARQADAGRIPRVAIYGAGESGVQLAHAMRSSQTYTPLCFVDDDPQLRNQHVAGLRVISLDTLRNTAGLLGVDEIVLAVPSASPAARHRIYNALTTLGLPVKTLPTLAELANRKVSDVTVRDIDVADLLGRAQVPPRKDLFAKCVTGKTVLVTGAGGSIGSELSRQVVSQLPAKLILLDHSEYSLYAIERELRERAPDVQITAVLASVCDAKGLDALLRRETIQTIYHAAAYKHVPLVEANAAEGVQNNVVGVWNVGLVAARYRVETCVLVSTDKAVRPTNVMGASKRVGELIFQALAKRAHGSTVFSMVRFGNVLDSSGSVVPLFRQQIRRGGPITLTHPEVVRYFMLIPEAAQLVMQAGAMGRNGEVYVLDMGAPVRIIDLARTLIKLSGLSERTAAQPDGDIEIQVTGLRPGEKLYEELLIGGKVEASAHPRIMASQEHMIELERLEPMLAHLLAACKAGDGLEVRKALQSVVTEYAPYSVLPDRNALPRREADAVSEQVPLVSSPPSAVSPMVTPVPAIEKSQVPVGRAA